MKKPNVILIVLDTARAANFSFYGYHKSTTPFLEDFCSKSNLFMNAFSPGIWTIPSHASLFTGTYPAQHGALNLHRHLDVRFVTLAEAMTAGGYDTAAFANNGFLSIKEFGLSRGFAFVEGKEEQGRGLVGKALKGLEWVAGIQDCGASETNRSVKKYLAERRHAEKPFFLFLNYMEAHAPYTNVPRKYLKAQLDRSSRKRVKHINQDRQRYLTRTINISGRDFAVLRSMYDAQIAYLDHRMEELMGILKTEKAFEDSFIIITSDHGDLIGEHGLMHHSYAVYEELIKIPLMVKLPGRAGNGKIHDHLVSLVDIFPTVVKAAGIGHSASSDQLKGIDLFSSGAPGERRYVYVECERPKNEFQETYPDFDFTLYDRQLLAIRSREDKYIWSSDGRHELYNIATDPAERQNLIATHHEKARLLDQALFAWYDSLEKNPLDTDKTIQIDEAVKERLQALGYF